MATIWAVVVQLPKLGKASPDSNPPPSPTQTLEVQLPSLRKLRGGGSEVPESKVASWTLSPGASKVIRVWGLGLRVWGLGFEV